MNRIRAFKVRLPTLFRVTVGPRKEMLLSRHDLYHLDLTARYWNVLESHTVRCR